METAQYNKVQSDKTTENIVEQAPGTNEEVTKKTKTSFLERVKWGWVFRCIIIVFILSGLNMFILTRLYHVPADQEGQAASSVIFLSGLLVIFFGSFITALLSPGKTITEPAIACAFIVIFSALTTGNSAGVLFGWIFPYFLGLAGARLGEYVSVKVGNRRHVQKQ